MGSWVATSYWILAVIWQLYTSGMLRVCSSRALTAQKHSPRPLGLLAPGNGRAAGRTEVFLPGGTDTQAEEMHSTISPLPADALPSASAGLGPVLYLCPSPSNGHSSSLCIVAASLPLDTMISDLLFLICMLMNEGFLSFLGLPLQHRGASSHGPPSCSGVPGSPEAAVAAWLVTLCCLTAAGHWKLCGIKAFHCCPCLPAPIAIKG